MNYIQIEQFNNEELECIYYDIDYFIKKGLKEGKDYERRKSILSKIKEENPKRENIKKIIRENIPLNHLSNALENNIINEIIKLDEL